LHRIGIRFSVEQTSKPKPASAHAASELAGAADAGHGAPAPHARSARDELEEESLV